MRTQVLVLLTSLVLAGCASGSGGEPSESRDRITSEQLAELSSGTAYEAIRRLRPAWLRQRGQVGMRGSPEGPVVYVDRARVGRVAELRQIRTADVAEIVFLDSRRATLEFGTGHPSGAIMVYTRSR